MTAGELKQDLLRVYNAINKKIFNVGVKQQKSISLATKSSLCRGIVESPSSNCWMRITPLYPAVGPPLFQVFKQEIKTSLEEQFPFKIISILKDYDAETEFSGTIVFLEKEVEAYLNDMPELG